MPAPNEDETDNTRPEGGGAPHPASKAEGAERSHQTQMNARPSEQTPGVAETERQPS